MNINVKFYMYFNGERIRTLEDLRDNFFAEDVLEAYNSGQLAKWLKVWRHKEELEQVEAIESENAREILKELMRIFDPEAEPEEIDAELTVYDYLEERRKFREHMKTHGLDELETLRKERDTLQRKQDVITRERDTVRHERDTFRKERDTLRSERDVITRERDTVRHERDTFRNERDTLRQENDRLKRELDEAKRRVSTSSTSSTSSTKGQRKRITIPTYKIRPYNWASVVPHSTACRITDIGNCRGKLFVFIPSRGNIPIETACTGNTILQGISVFFGGNKATEDLYFYYEEV